MTLCLNVFLSWDESSLIYEGLDNFHDEILDNKGLCVYDETMPVEFSIPFYNKIVPLSFEYFLNLIKEKTPIIYVKG